MDLQLYLRVLWRFRQLVVAGTALAVLLGVLAVARVEAGFPPLAYRQNEQWLSYTTLLVTQKGFPWGRTVIDTESGSERQKVGAEPPFADPSRLTSLAVIYSKLAESDEVAALARRDDDPESFIEVAPQLLTTSGPAEALPLISIAAFDRTPERAIALGRREAKALQRYVEKRQQAAHVAIGERVLLEPVREAKEAELFAGRSYTPAIVVFLSVFLAVVALALVLENLRPQVREIVDATPEPEAKPTSRRRPARRTA